MPFYVAAFSRTNFQRSDFISLEMCFFDVRPAGASARLRYPSAGSNLWRGFNDLFVDFEWNLSSPWTCSLAFACYLKLFFSGLDRAPDFVFLCFLAVFFVASASFIFLTPHPDFFVFSVGSCFFASGGFINNKSRLIENVILKNVCH